jgi:hypothetical protein
MYEDVAYVEQIDEEDGADGTCKFELHTIYLVALLVLYHLLLCFLSHIAYHVTIICKFHYGYQYIKNNADSKINAQVIAIQLCTSCLTSFCIIYCLGVQKPIRHRNSLDDKQRYAAYVTMHTLCMRNNGKFQKNDKKEIASFFPCDIQII